jgi:hypothetical protein
MTSQRLKGLHLLGTEKNSEEFFAASPSGVHVVLKGSGRLENVKKSSDLRQENVEGHKTQILRRTEFFD